MHYVRDVLFCDGSLIGETAAGGNVEVGSRQIHFIILASIDYHALLE